MKTIGLLTCLLALSGCRSLDAGVVDTGEQENPRNPLAAAQFERLKTLDGEYVAIQGDGDASTGTPIRYHLTAAGKTLTETCFAGMPHEMLTTIYLDRGELVLTHYCAAGNQPHMVAEPGTSDRSIVFHCVGGGNLVDCSEPHMHRAEYTFGEDGSVSSLWTFYENGEAQNAEAFRLVKR
jgi:hypothetical protein